MGSTQPTKFVDSRNYVAFLDHDDRLTPCFALRRPFARIRTQTFCTRTVTCFLPGVCDSCTCLSLAGLRRHLRPGPHPTIQHTVFCWTMVSDLVRSEGRCYLLISLCKHPHSFLLLSYKLNKCKTGFHPSTVVPVQLFYKHNVPAQ